MVRIPRTVGFPLWLTLLLTVTPGKNWHAPKKPFRPGSGLTSYEKRLEQRKHLEAVKERERELKEEKEAERQVRQRYTLEFSQSDFCSP